MKVLLAEKEKKTYLNHRTMKTECLPTINQPNYNTM